MKIFFTLLIVLSACNLLQAQNINQQKNDSVCQLVKKYLNEKNFVALYALAGEAFKNSLSQDAFKNICENNLFPIGELNETVFENYDNGVSKYKAVFNSINLYFLLSIDKNDKIELFLFKPYVDENAR